MKKTEATRWEKLEGEGQESNIKHFNPRKSTRCCTYLHAPVCTGHLLIFLPAKINMGSRGCLLSAKARVGSGAPREPFISLTVKVGREDEGDDGKT